MRIKGFILMVCLSVFFLLPGLNQAQQAQSRQKKGVALKLTGGMNYMLLGDWNDFMNGWTDYYKNGVYEKGGTVEGELKSIRWGLDFEGDVIINFNPRFGITIGSGYISGKKAPDAKKMTLYYPDETIRVNHDMKISAIPVKIGVYYCLFRSSKFRFFLSGGIGYYFAKISEVYKNQWDGSWSHENQSAKGEEIGFHGGMGLELDIFKNIAIVVEGYGRYAKIKDLTGERDWSMSFGPSDSRKGGLYYFDLDIPSYGLLPYIEISSGTPGGLNRRNVRRATVDLSGFAVRIGVKIRLF
jgi:opacity protein-like surface antigen